MKTAKEIQEYILEKTGLKTSVKLYSNGSMNGYVRIMPIYQGGKYPNIPIETVIELKEILSEYDYQNKPLLCSCSDINVYGISNENIQMKKEAKPKQIENMNQRTWGSENSQLRLDKAAARYAKRLSKGNCARYY